MSDPDADSSSCSLSLSTVGKGGEEGTSGVDADDVDGHGGGSFEAPGVLAVFCVQSDDDRAGRGDGEEGVWCSVGGGVVIVVLAG